jgi:ABC-type uncharacterized transport system permease subunit
MPYFITNILSTPEQHTTNFRKKSVNVVKQTQIPTKQNLNLSFDFELYFLCMFWTISQITLFI